MSKQKAPWYKYYPADMMNDMHVRCMTNEEFGVYQKLLNFCWIEDGLPNDPSILCQLAMNERSTSVQQAFNEIWKVLSPRFQEGPDGRLRNSRLEKERDHYESLRVQRSEAGRASGKARNERSTSVQRARSVSLNNIESESDTESERITPCAKAKGPVEAISRAVSDDAKKLGERFINFIEGQKGFMVPEADKAQWMVNAERLNAENGVGWDRQGAAASWYMTNTGRQYVPVINNGAHWRTKFLQIEAAMRRAEDEGKTEAEIGMGL